MIKIFSCLILLFVLMLDNANAQDEQLSEAAKVLFNGVTTTLSNAKKNSIVTSLMLKLDSNNKLVYTNGKGNQVYTFFTTVDLNKDGIDEYFISFKEDMNQYDGWGRIALFTNNKNDNKCNILPLGMHNKIYYHKSKSFMPDIMFPTGGKYISSFYKWNNSEEKYERDDKWLDYTLDDCTLITGLNIYSPQLKKDNNGLKPGDIAANAKILDAGYCLKPFNMGAALIIKGTAQALIDSASNFISSPNDIFFKYDYIYPPSSLQKNYCSENREDLLIDYSSTGLYEFYSPKDNTIGLMNSKGKILFTYPSNVSHTWKTVYVTNNKEYPGVIVDYPGVSYVDYMGNKTAKYITDRSPVREGLVVCSLRDQEGNLINNEYKYGFKNLKGVYTILPVFDFASSFSDGFAVVGKKNEFNQMMYGYIDKTGKIVIPLMYSKQPGDFGNGLAVVTPKTQSQDFDFGFINKKNEIVLKIPMNSKIIAGGKFMDGYYFFGSNVMDTTGKIFEGQEFLGKTFNLNTDTYLINGSTYKDGFVFYSPKKTDYDFYGLIDLKKNTYLPAIFSTLSKFDPVSNLAYAKLFLYKDKTNNQDIYREGYINREGIFVIVKGKESAF